MKIGSTIYLGEVAVLTASTLAKEIKRLFPSNSEPVRAPAASGADNLLAIGDVVVALLMFDRPQPDDPLLDAYRLNFIWPEAEKVIGEHRAHVVLSVFGEPSGFEKVSLKSKALSMVTLALASFSQALAIYWHSSMALVKKENFATTIQRLNEGSPPLDLWVSYSPWVDQSAKEIGLFSVGLQNFVGYEIEIVPRKESLGEVLQRAIALTGYILERGPVLKDGSTIGYSETEKLRVKFADDGQEETILQITTEQVQ